MVNFGPKTFCTMEIADNAYNLQALRHVNQLNKTIFVFIKISTMVKFYSYVSPSTERINVKV